MKSNGRGTITFESSSASKSNEAPCFEMIDNAKMVYEQIKRIQRENT